MARSASPESSMSLMQLRPQPFNRPFLDCGRDGQAASQMLMEPEEQRRSATGGPHEVNPLWIIFPLILLD